MALATILEQGNPALTQISQPVVWPDDSLDEDIQQLQDTLANFRQKNGFGRAIAAPQIGIHRRIIALNLGATPFVVINPEITWHSEECFDVWDDCLSVPDYVVKVQRYTSVSIRYQDETGRFRNWQRLPRDLSELIQHEMDHLDGVLMTDRAIDADSIRPITEHAKLVAGNRHTHRLSLDAIKRASAEIAPEFLHSPQYHSEPLSEIFGCELWLKVETANPIRSFKGRGADFFVKQLTKQNDTRPLVCASAGNFGQAMAYACRRENRPLVVYASQFANSLKILRMKQLGAEVRLHGNDFDAAKAAARKYCSQHNAYMVEDGKDAAISEGAGSIGVELMAGIPVLDAIVIPLGNGALINGIARWVKAASPTTQIIGVCSENADAMHASWKHQQIIERDNANTIADGIAVRVPVPEAVTDMQDLVDDVVIVNEQAIIDSIRLLAEHTGLIVEPAGAVGVAAIAQNTALFKGKHIATILCGSNVTSEQLTNWLAL